MMRPHFPLTLAIALFLAACGGSPDAETPHTAADASPPPAEVMRLVTQLVNDNADTQLFLALKAAVAQSGFQVVPAGAIPHDVEIHLTMTKDYVQTFFVVQVNGQTRQKIRVNAVAAVVAQGRLVDQLQVTYEGYQGEAPPAWVTGTLVEGFAKSKNVAALARALKSTDSVGTAPSASASASPPSGPKTSPAEDSAWYAINVAKCKSPLKLDACDDVRRFLTRFPDGAHAAEARAAIAEGAPALDELQKDDNMWQEAQVPGCRAKHNKDACLGVQIYLEHNPAGLHSEEAKRLLGKD